MIKTTSINVMNLCVPCENFCRYCLLAWDGAVRGISDERAHAYVLRLREWLQENHADVAFHYAFGYAMEHPRLLEEIDFLRSIGSVGSRFLQMDGLKFRTREQTHTLLADIHDHGVESIDLTFYGTETYHDRFAARQGDFAFMMILLEEALKVGLRVTVSLPLTGENVEQAEELLERLQCYPLTRTFAFVPHAEGRGRTLESIRFSKRDYDRLGERTRSLLNREKFRPEGEWVRHGQFSVWEKRSLGLTLTPENITMFEEMDCSAAVRYLETLDEDYFAVMPPLAELAARYGNTGEERFYSERDLYLKYQRRYIAENQLDLYDINDERQCFVRRY